jgi:hypothetical protein
MAFKVSMQVLERERAEREKALAEVEFYKQRCEDYQRSVEWLRKREAALVHRLTLVENAQVTAVSQLHGAIQEDVIREDIALDDLQDKIEELEESEYQKALALKDFAEGLNNQALQLKREFISGVENIQKDLTRSIGHTLLRRNQEVRNELENLRADVQTDISKATEGLSQSFRHVLIEYTAAQRGPLKSVLTAFSNAFNVQLDDELFWEAIRLDVSLVEREKSKNRFIATCQLPRITMLENALRDAQDAEARAKRVALRIAAKKDQELESERQRADNLSKRLEQALDALEKVRADFDNVSMVVSEISRRT